MANIDLITIVYGEVYTRYFINFSLPTQLSPGNIPALKGRLTSTYCIYTTEIDAKIIIDSPAYKILSSLINVKFITFPSNDIRDPVLRRQGGVNDYYLMSVGYRHALTNPTGDYFAFLAPDWIVADGSFRAAELRVEQGYDAVMVICPRPSREEAEPFLKQRMTQEGVISITSKEVGDILFHHPHPVTQTLTHDINWKCDVFNNSWPSVLIWRDEQVGIICHSCHLHPFVVKRGAGNADFKSTIDGDYMTAFPPGSPNIYFAGDSDEICIADSTNKSYKEGTEEDKLAKSPAGLFFFADWLYKYNNHVNLWFLRPGFVFRKTGSDDRNVDEKRQKIAKTVDEVLRACHAINGLPLPPP